MIRVTRCVLDALQGMAYLAKQSKAMPLSQVAHARGLKEKYLAGLHGKRGTKQCSLHCIERPFKIFSMDGGSLWDGLNDYIDDIYPEDETHEGGVTIWGWGYIDE